MNGALAAVATTGSSVSGGPADLAAVGPLDLLGDSQSTSGEGCATSELPQVDQRLMNAVAPRPVLRRLHTSELMT